MEPIHTLVVDDEAGIRFFVKETLQRIGHKVAVAVDGQDALAQLRDRRFDLVMIDLRLGGRVGGLKVLEAVRWRWPDAATIILTAHGSLESAMKAIREGVGRYLLKPVTSEDLRRAVNEVLTAQRERRARMLAQVEEPDVLEGGPIRIDIPKHEVTFDGVPLELALREFDLLVHLMRHRDRVVSPVELVEVLRDYRPEDLREARSIMKWYVHRLRQRIEPDPAHPQFIVNIRGVGYRFES